MPVNLNGDLSQWTNGTTFAACQSGKMTADMHRYMNTSSAVHTVRQSADVPQLTSCGIVIPYSMEVEVTGADAAAAAAEYTAITYRGEGSEWADLAEEVVSVGFYAKSFVAGKYFVHLGNGAETLSIVESYDINDVGTWRPFIVDFPKAPGTWWTDNRVGYTVAWSLACGSNFYATPGLWNGHAASAWYLGAAQQTNFNATVGNKFNLTAVRIGPRRMIERFFQPPEDVQFACQRYLWSTFPPGTAPATQAGRAGAIESTVAIGGANAQQSPSWNRHPRTMRKTPSYTFYNPVNNNAFMRNVAANTDATATAAQNASPDGFGIGYTGLAAWTAGQGTSVHVLADATLPAMGQNVGG